MIFPAENLFNIQYNIYVAFYIIKQIGHGVSFQLPDEILYACSYWPMNSVTNLGQFADLSVSQGFDLYLSVCYLTVCKVQ